MKFLDNNKVYFKSDYSDINIGNNINLADHVINCMKSKKNEIMLTDEQLNRVSSYDIIHNSEKVAKGFNLLGQLNKNDIVGFILPNMIEFSYCILGSLLCGLVVSPINPVSTIDEIKNTLSALSPKILIVNHDTYIRIKDQISQMFNQCIAVIVINDSYDKPIHSIESPPIDNSNNSQCKFKIIDFKQFINNDGKYDREKSIVDSIKDTAFILFSSGTTGNFKGVCLTHYNSLSNIKQVIKSKYELYKEKQISITSLPFYHTFALHEILLCILCFGGGFIFLKRYNLESFLRLVQNEKATLALIVPPIGIDLAKSPLVEKYDCSSLKLIYSGAAPFPKDIIDQLKKRIGLTLDKSTNQLVENLKLFQGYGLTELVGFVSICNPYQFKVGSSGILSSNIIAKVVDIETGKQLDTNQVGELCFKSPSVMKGYFNNINATSDSIDDEGFYCTGDIGYFDDDGELYIIDRKKELIKSYGYQVAPAELESVLLTHTKVKDACVVGVPNDKAGEVPRAFIVIDQGEQLTENEIHEWLAPKVSYYKHLRGGIYFIDIIPKSPSGKLLRRKLRDQIKSKL